MLLKRLRRQRRPLRLDTNGALLNTVFELFRNVVNLCLWFDLFQTYAQAFEKIREVTGIQDTDKLVKRFIEGMSRA